jgi:hypothetical protein
VKLVIHSLFVAFLCLILLTNGLQGRSVHRKAHGNLPQITVSWAHNNKGQVSLRDSHLEQYPFFELFDKKYFYDHLLPDSFIAPRYPQKTSTRGDKLKADLEILVQEIQTKKKHYSHFNVLTSKNFNRNKRAGMLILKYKHAPYIVKISTENPDSFLNPFCKGLDNVWFFPMGGGVNRHLAGFTRVKNREQVKRKLEESAEWSNIIDVPRKWFWIPQHPLWLSITGHNVGTQKKQTTVIPACYAIVADAIDVERELELNNEGDTNLALRLCNYLDHAIDAHINNFVIEKETKKIIIIDTEHFPSVVGIKEKIQISSYFDWYTFLLKQCGTRWFFRTKKERLANQMRPRTIKLT